MPDAADHGSHALVWVNGNPVSVPDATWPAGETPRAVLRLSGPVRPQWRQRLTAERLRVHFWCPPTGVCVEVPARYRRSPAHLQALGFVAGGVDYTGTMCQRPAPPVAAARSAHDGSPEPALPPHLIDVVCFDRRTRAAVERELAARGIPVLHAGTTKLRVSYEGDLGVLRDLPGVKLAGPARLPRLLSAAELRASVGAPPSIPNPWDLAGEGEVIAVADTGLDSGDVANGMHPDFAARIRALQSLPMNQTWAAFATPLSEDAADRASGHGTHVAGLALGSGAASHGVHGGLAPKSELVFLALEQQVNVLPAFQARLPSGYYLAGRPVDLRELYRAAAAHGATLHNLSWGDPTQGVYTDDCFETDLYLTEAPGDVVVCAAGNDGMDRDGNRQIDNGSIYAPACAKNTIAVGATEGPSQGVGLRATWSALDPAGRRWPLADRADPISGEPDRIAPMSSSGPTHDGRTKPDLCAPGTNLASTRSRLTTYQGWGLADPLPLYMYDGGTSMAAPVITGAMALIRQAWRTRGSKAKATRAPSGAALKALVLLACTPVRGRGAGPATRFEAGFGKLDVARALPPALGARPGWTVTVRDAASQRVETGQHRDIALHLPRTSRVRAVLCWYDPPGERLINDLDLTLLDAHKHPLDGDDSSRPPAGTDRVNTVECIDRAGLLAGGYFLRVTGFNVMDGPQRYALVWAVEDAAP